MTLVTGTVQDLGYDGMDGTLWARPARFRSDGSVVLAPERKPFKITGGVVSAELAPGPAVLELQVGSHARGTFEVVIPDADTTLADLLDTVFPWEPEQVSLFVAERLAAEAAKVAAETAAGDAEGAASVAEGHRTHVDAIRDLLDEAAQSNVAPYLTETALNATYGQAVEHDWTAPQHFQPGQSNGPLAFKIGDKLGVRMHDGNKGIRFALIGLDQPPGVDEVMPYFEVIAKTRTGTDGGAAVAGYQLHLGPDPGNSINREFFYIEAVGELHGDGPHFRLGVHASGTGVRRPWRLENMGTTAVFFEPNSTVKFGHKIVGDQLQSPVEFTRQGSNLTAISGITYGTGSAQTFLGFANGTEGAGEAPGSGRALGSHMFGSKNGTATVLAGVVRMVTSEAWTFGTAQGTRAEVLITPRGTSSNTVALTVDDPSNNQVGAVLLVNRGGTTTSSRVTIGPVDSAGTGYRVLRVAN